MSQYLLEIGCEEIPARFLERILGDIQQGLEKELQGAGLLSADYTVETFATYRRLALRFNGVVLSQDAVTQTMTGPPLAIAKDENGAWTPAAQGFAKKAGVNIEALKIGTDAKGREILMADVTEAGREFARDFPEILQQVIAKLSLPIAMRWGANEGPFVRPVHWIVSLLDDAVLPLSLFGVEAGAESQGHRFLSDGAVSVANAAAYEDAMIAGKVMVNIEKRQGHILSELQALDVDDRFDAGLLREVCHLLEWPTVLAGEFSTDYLALPESVLVQCMQKHQKYFPLFTDGRLNGRYAVVADSVTDANAMEILRGNGRVLAARLHDVMYFWRSDNEQGLAAMLPMLSRVIFQEGMGSLADKAKRVTALSQSLASILGYEGDASVLQRAAELAKADLMSQMVNELPSLQGEIGAAYAAEAGETAAVVQGIREQYMPRGEKDALPASDIGRLLAISDRLDTMLCCFENNLIPSGSKDPWGIRQSIYAILRIVIAAGISVDFSVLVDAAYSVLDREASQREAVLAFVQTRMKQFYLDQGGQPDTVAAVLAVGMDPYRQLSMIREIDGYREAYASEFKTIVDMGVRVGRLVNGGDVGQGVVQENLFQEAIESEAYAAFQALSAGGGMADLAAFAVVMGRYFDDVMVNAEDVTIRGNRLAFIRDLGQFLVGLSDFEAYTV